MGDSKAMNTAVKVVDGNLIDYINSNTEYVARLVTTNSAFIPTNVAMEKQYQVTAELCCKYLAAHGVFSRIVNDLQCPWFIAVLSTGNNTTIHAMASPRCRVVAEFKSRNNNDTLLLICPIPDRLVSKPKK